MIGVITGFIEQLRAVGIPVSMVEALDAARGLDHIDLSNRHALRALLGATLVKSARHQSAFEATFDAYFSLVGPGAGSPEDASRSAAALDLIAEGASGGGGGGGDAADLIDALLHGLEIGDQAMLAAVARAAVDRFGGIEPGRPVGGAYYLYRVMRQLDIDRIEAQLREDAMAGVDNPLVARGRSEDVDRRVRAFRQLVETEIRRRLVADRGAVALARTLRRPLIEDIDLAAATRQELAEVERAVYPLGRRLATRLSQRRSQGRRGRLDVRHTMRAALSTGGVPVDPRFRSPRPGKPELVLLCDVSGSVATFARFTMQLVFAIASQFSRVRTFAFIDGIDEVTSMLAPGADFVSAMERISTEAEVVWLDGHSDYGHAFSSFTERYLDAAVTARTSVIVTGDARSNYHDPAPEAFAAISERARGVFWLNPEPTRYWNTGDSVMGAYEEWCDETIEVRTLRQLEAFVERVSLPAARRVPVPG